ncbi:PAS domain-containing protein [Heliorestis convoluta]|uniref:PAS domain S-box protein n=1 Tax=Heliorestis convoluta TaxID=356322 RepID=A0A5Q2MZ97_9FIRM|nr:PAS domain-containing protein [Heliorestis convoluta]QGG46769.1 PAS domain S-box protein [Heliorestis convoluta]
MKVSKEQERQGNSSFYQNLLTIVGDFFYVIHYEKDQPFLHWHMGHLVEEVPMILSLLLNQDEAIDYVHLDDQLLLSHFQEVIATGERSRLTFRFIDPKGQTRWFQYHAIPEKDNELGKVTRIYGFIRDVTEQELAWKARELYEREVEARRKQIELHQRNKIAQLQLAIFYQRLFNKLIHNTLKKTCNGTSEVSLRLLLLVNELMDDIFATPTSWNKHGTPNPNEKEPISLKDVINPMIIFFEEMAINQNKQVQISFDFDENKVVSLARKPFLKMILGIFVYLLEQEEGSSHLHFQSKNSRSGQVFFHFYIEDNRAIMPLRLFEMLGNKVQAINWTESYTLYGPFALALIEAKVIAEESGGTFLLKKRVESGVEIQGTFPI